MYNFCEVCCDHLVFVYQNAAEKNIIGELLQLKQEQGIKAIKDIVNKNIIKKCKVECKKEYPVDMPQAKQKPPRDPELGTEKKPAMTCMDIKKWGAKTVKSGVFWIELPSKGPQKVFCDMETDNGGWTLFFNYVHQPGMELNLNENKLPEDLKTNSHMYLENAGFSPRDVKEVRFFCTERFKTNKKYWHFKSSNRDFFNVAFKGDQTGLRPNSLATGYSEIRPPAAIMGKYSLAVDKNQINSFDIVGNSPSGGFTATIFGSTNYESNWTVKGESSVQDIFECGSSHKNAAATSPEDSPSMVFTHHSVWFRGSAPPSDEAKERYLSYIAK